MKKRYIKISEDDLETFRHCYAMVECYHEELAQELKCLYFALERIEKRNKEQKVVKIS